MRPRIGSGGDGGGQLRGIERKPARIGSGDANLDLYKNDDNYGPRRNGVVYKMGLLWLLLVNFGRSYR